jgi:hypothetical protein
MKTQKIAKILSGVLLAFWLLPWYGKKLLPSLFGGWAVQWTFAVIVAILAPVLVLIGLRLLFCTDLKKSGFTIVLAASMPIWVNAGVLGVGGLSLARVNSGVNDLNRSDVAAMRLLSDRSITADSPEDRLKNAEVLYQSFGVQAVWKNAQGDLERYLPGSEQEAAWQRTQETHRQMREISEMLDGRMEEIHKLLALTMGSFALVFLSGLAWFAFRSKSEITGPQNL